MDRSLVKLASLARTELLLDPLPALLGLIAWLALCTLLVFLSLLFLAGQTALGSLARGARFAYTDRTGASGLLRRLSLLDLLGFLLPPNFYGGPLRGPP